ncbi:transcriptional regulator [Arenibaculum sp.]|uniref:helix-turn-helix transcriptional regulator n=1 Tax=Arenibaculum sp. TaxID=2865862 RepID=UPI002E112F70|nr:transcriptional regulator [Arenibaculum sp.]
MAMFTPEQCRAARALLDWSQAELAKRSGVAWSTVKSFEGGKHALLRANRTVIRAAFEAGGIVFLDPEDDLGPGVRLRRAPEPWQP